MVGVIRYTMLWQLRAAKSAKTIGAFFRSQLINMSLEPSPPIASNYIYKTAKASKAGAHNKSNSSQYNPCKEPSEIGFEDGYSLRVSKNLR